MRETVLRPYDPERDLSAVLRIWKEAGWVPPGKEEATAFMLSCGRPMVAELEGQAECFVQTVPGTLRYLEEDLPFSGVAAVATGVFHLRGDFRHISAAWSAPTLLPIARCAIPPARPASD